MTVGLLAAGRSDPDQAGAAGAGPQMSLQIGGGNVSCDKPAGLMTCTAQFDPEDSANGAFVLSVRATRIPSNGYGGFGAEIVGLCSPDLAGRNLPAGGVGPPCPQNTLVWNPRKIDAQNDPDPAPQVSEAAPDPNDADSCAAEVVWQDLRGFCVASVGPAGQRQLAAATAFTPPFPVSTDIATLIELDVRCPSEGAYEIVLTASPTAPFGAIYLDPDGANSVVKTVATRNLDLDGDGALDSDGATGTLLEYAIADGLTIDCLDTGSPPSTEGPLATDTPAPEPGEARSPTPTLAANGEATPPPPAPADAGDVSCDGVTDSIDAFLLLAFLAGLSHSLPCGALADANSDSTVTTEDAQVILQFDAGLIRSLPPRSAAASSWAPSATSAG